MGGLDGNSRIEPLAVFMPAEGGLGAIDAVQWPGDVPAVGLDDLLSLLRPEPDFDPTSVDGASIIDAIRPLVRATPYPDLTAPPPTESFERPACPACGEPYEEGLTYCLECGQVRRT
ncbi:MAG: TFIIB-type zinc finger domain-containing protein [Propionibacteriales bacterium]|nr:TFIIB-type zinc finger domain-containing protein [Propionibacteriales bacterium]